MPAETDWNGSTKLQKKNQGEENLKVESCVSLAAPQKTWWFNEGKTLLSKKQAKNLIKKGSLKKFLEYSISHQKKGNKT